MDCLHTTSADRRPECQGTQRPGRVLFVHDGPLVADLVEPALDHRASGTRRALRRLVDPGV